MVYDERWEEVWRRRCRGESIASIALDLEVHRNTVVSWYERYCALEVSRSADSDSERAFLIGRFESMALRAMDAFESSLQEDIEWHTDPRPAHMANAIKALQMVARLYGMDVRTQRNLHLVKGESEITIKVGGEEMVRRRVKRDPGVLNGQAIEVAAGDVVGLGDGPGGTGAAGDGEVPGDG